jgi:hypothetical protein
MEATNRIDTFNETISLAEFKARYNATTGLRVTPVTRPDGSRRVFFIMGTPQGNLAGSVSRKFEEQGNSLKKPVVSNITSGEYTGWLLHEQGELPEAIAEF